MTTVDAQFAGQLPHCYELYLVPLLFDPYARDLAGRAAGLAPRQVLEIAAGTGVVTRHLAAALPSARIVATDLNPDMLAIGSATALPQVSWQLADAAQLPFSDAGFDLVLCQFGAMFFPDRPQAFAQARRVLRPGGRFLFNVWDPLPANAFAAGVQAAMEELFPDDPPGFFARTPHGYHDKAAIVRDLAAAGFTSPPDIETVALQSSAASAADVAAGFCQGTPLRSEIEARGHSPESASAFAARHLEQRYGKGPVRGAMRAHVISVAA
ncbi:class I SAM-dependent methyltransferase [Pseudoduganella umbonata]|uniref:SAM-dependent methyltransferase n=1 Tax=Pseudoduganella umbonata TaxID=864828 RepID=A0A4P8HSU5_9BURK|nr:class I SAM-dependent methyltransferase [Pseudoduganella umbonata]MBB3220815.1 SAM-dependent methyltransferase [Pseudoduganella umbonata]QCP11718.1 class I SAM-dependent methyltransferase [Pseudoduganella umbonata]